MLEGSRVVLRPPLDADRPLLSALRNDLQIQVQLMALPRANSKQRVEEWISRRLSDPACVFFVAAEPAGNKALGFVQLSQMDFVHGTADLGICFAEAARGGGRAAEALILLECYARDVFNIRKIVLRVLASNRRAARLYAKSGYGVVGVLKRHFYHKRAHHDVVIYEKFIA